MDGQVAVIREALDGAGFTDVAVMAYAGQYHYQKLLEAGAHHYAWLRPGERFETESHSALGLPDSDSEEISEPGSCRSFPHGAGGC